MKASIPALTALKEHPIMGGAPGGSTTSAQPEVTTLTDGLQSQELLLAALTLVIYRPICPPGLMTRSLTFVS